MEQNTPRLLTEAEWLKYIKDCGLWESDARRLIPGLHVLGLIADEPVDPDLEEAREICAKWCEAKASYNSAERYRSGEWDGVAHMEIALAALRRGRELAKPLTREMVRDAVAAACSAPWTHGGDLEDRLTDNIHAALVERMK